MLQEADVLLRRAQEDRHLIEAHPTSGFIEDTAHDLDSFASFARRREQADVARSLPGGRTIDREDVAAQVRKIGGLRCRIRTRFHLRTQPDHRVVRKRIAIRHRGEGLGRTGDERADEFPLGPRIERDVEEYDRQSDPGSTPGRARFRGQVEQRGAVADCRPLQLCLDTHEQPADIGNSFATFRRGRQRPGLCKPFRADGCQPELVERAGQSLGKARHQGNGREICEIAGGHGIEHGARRGRLRAGPRAGHPVRPGEARGGDT